MSTGLELYTDLYQLTMAYGYWKSGIHEQRATFDLYFRDLKGLPGAIVCGTRRAQEIVDNFELSRDDCSYLRSLGFDHAFVQYLENMTMYDVKLEMMPEGNLTLPYSPIAVVSGPLLKCQLLETILLNVIGFETMIASKTAEMVVAAGGKPIYEFGARRAQGPDGGLSAAYAAYIGGAKGTSNVLAGQKFFIPVIGTHAHSWVQAFPDELTAFQTYAETYPDNCTLLIDTYDTIRGAHNAVKVGEWLRSTGHKLKAVRIDDPNVDLIENVRYILDEADLYDTDIIVSGGLDKEKITDLSTDPYINAFGVGEQLVTGGGMGFLGCVYKLTSLDGEPRMKVCKDNIQKSSLPGDHVVYNVFIPRVYALDSQVITLREEEFERNLPLIVAPANTPSQLKPSDQLAAKMTYGEQHSFRHNFTKLGYIRIASGVYISPRIQDLISKFEGAV